MNCRFDNHVRTGAFLLAVLFAASTSTFAQSGTAAAAPDGVRARPAPRTPNGHPDLTGVWWPGNGNPDLFAPGFNRKFDPDETPQERPSFQPWALEKIKLMGDLTAVTPHLGCEPRGMPGLMTAGFPMQFIQTPGQLVVLTEIEPTYRVIPTDGRPLPENPDPAFKGTAAGRWEGDTLVVEVIGVDVRTWVDGRGWFHSDQMRITERFRRPDAETFIYQYTVEDPKVLTKPWTSVPHRWTLANEPLYEYYCTNEKDSEVLNREDHRPLTLEGADERYFDEREYQRMRQEYQ